MVPVSPYNASISLILMEILFECHTLMVGIGLVNRCSYRDICGGTDVQGALVEQMCRGGGIVVPGEWWNRSAKATVE